MELSLDIDWQTPIRMAVLTQLRNLSSLKMCHTFSHNHGQGEPLSYVLDHPGLKSLRVAHFEVNRLELHCPRLRNLTVYCCHCFEVPGSLSLQAPLDKLFWSGYRGPTMHVGFPTSNVFGLSHLHIGLFGQSSRDILLKTLPLMFKLKTLDLFIHSGHHGEFPDSEELPASLQAIRYVIMKHSLSLRRRGQSLAKICQLPNLQSMTLLRWGRWDAEEQSMLKRVKEQSKAQLILKENIAAKDYSSMLEAFE